MSSPQEHDQLFGTLSPTPLFFRLAVPSMISMAVTSLYTIADGVFVGHFIGAGALAAVNLVMPLIMMSFALADMLAVGSAVQIAIRLGERREAEASKIFSFACGMILFISLVIGAAAFGLADGLVSLLGADGPVAAMAVEYIQVYAVFSPFIMIFFALDNYLRICGRIRYSMVLNIVISVANIALDALFIAVFGWGIGSAALASCLCLACGTILGLWPFLRGKMALHFVKGRLPLRTIGNIITNGSSEFFANISGSVCMVLFNTALMNLSGYLAVAAFSIVMYVDSIVKSVLFGMSDALQPAISYNYGAADKKRVFALERRVQAAGFLLSLATLLFMFFQGDTLIALFSQEESAELLSLSTRAMQLFALSYLVSWCAVVSSSFFTALNRPFCSLVLSVCHTLVFPVLFLAILPNIWGLDGIWLTSLFAGSCTAVLAAGLIIWVVYQLKREPAAPHVSVTKKGVSADAAAS